MTNWFWTFGDATTGTAQNPTHVYTNAATYTPSLTAYSTYDSAPLIVSGPGSVSVSVPNLVASARPLFGALPLTVEFSTPSVDSDGYTVRSWNWNFGDGANSTAQDPSHTYTVPGICSAKLSVRSTYGLDSIIYAHGFITVKNLPNPAFKLLHGFSAGTGNSYVSNSDGAGSSSPKSDLLLSGNVLYGTTSAGGQSGNGTMFGFVLPTQLNIALAGTNVVLTWAANNVTNMLQSTLKLQTGAVGSAVSPLPVVINGMNTVTNPVTAAPKYYRLDP